MKFDLIFAFNSRLSSWCAAFIWLLVTPLATSCQPSTPKKMPADYKDKTRAPDFPKTATWHNTDHPLSMAELKGKIVLLDFWTYCCINCIHVLPDLKRLEHEYPQLVVVGVHSAKFLNEKDPENIRQAVLRYDIEHPVIVDSDFYLWRQYAINAWPSFALIDPAGNVVGRASGEGVYDIVKPYIEELTATYAAKGQLDTVRKTFALERQKRPGSYLSYPGKITADRANNRLFFTDANHNRIIATDLQGKILMTIGSGEEGKGDGTFETASFFRPQGLTYDPVADALYIADTENHLIRLVDLKAKTVRTILGNGQQSRYMTKEAKGTQGPINSPWDLVIDGNQLIIAMAGPHQLWQMDRQTFAAQVFAGSGREDITDGKLLQAALAQPSGICKQDNTFYFADSEVSALRKVDNGAVKTLIGEGLFEFGDEDGKYPEARLQHCLGVDVSGDIVYIADTYNHKIKTYNTKTQRLETLVGTGKRGLADGPANSARLNEPNDVCVLNDKLYITDTNNDLIRVFDLKTKQLSTFSIQAPEQLSMLNRKRANPSAKMPFWGQEIQLKPVKIQQNKAQLSLNIQLPKGYKLNAQAPNYATLRTPSAQQDLNLTLANSANGSFTVQQPVEISDGQVELEVGLYYCDANFESKCYIKQLHIIQPVQIDASASTQQLSIDYTLAP